MSQRAPICLFTIQSKYKIVKCHMVILHQLTQDPSATAGFLVDRLE